MTATRAVFWGVPRDVQIFFYLAAGLAVLIFLAGLWSRVSIWTAGRDDERFSGFGAWDFILFALRSFFSKNCILARKSFALATYRGVMLFFIIWGFSTLFLGTALLTVHHYTIPFLVGNPYLIFSFALDIAGIVLLAGILAALGRRIISPEVRRVTTREDTLFLLLFLLIIISGFMVEGIRLTALKPLNMDYSYGGALFASVMSQLRIERYLGYTAVWGVHVSSVLFIIAYLPFSKFFHVFASQISVAAAEERYGGAISGRGY